MTGKRALIVDDSKSARAFLGKILERHELLVDSAESAEQAIDYLADHRPDVIFMDHLMPGMDGFQAVQAIKNNPRTAMIPIMMYTSQEGELYLGQARALGAVGVLPKQIKPADVSKVLYQLHLAQERRTGEQTSFKPYVADAADTVEEIELAPIPPVAHPLTDIGLREQLSELRRALMTGLDSQSERVAADVRSMFLEGLPSSRPHASVPWLVTLLALIVAISAAVLWRQEAQRSRVLTTQLAEMRDIQRRENAPPALAAGQAPFTARPQAGAALPAPQPIVAQIPYGEDTFAGGRIDLIRSLLRRLQSQNFRGAVEIASFPGRFCLVGNQSEGYSVAPDETPVSRCDLVGNPYEESQAGARQPLALANLIGDFRHGTRGAADVRLTTGDSATVVNTYPAATPTATAGEWNRAAAANNRIEIRVH